MSGEVTGDYLDGEVYTTDVEILDDEELGEIVETDFNLIDYLTHFEPWWNDGATSDDDESSDGFTQEPDEDD